MPVGGNVPGGNVPDGGIPGGGVTGCGIPGGGGSGGSRPCAGFLARFRPRRPLPCSSSDSTRSRGGATQYSGASGSPYVSASGTEGGSDSGIGGRA